MIISEVKPGMMFVDSFDGESTIAFVISCTHMREDAPPNRELLEIYFVRKGLIERTIELTSLNIEKALCFHKI